MVNVDDDGMKLVFDRIASASPRKTTRAAPTQPKQRSPSEPKPELKASSNNPTPLLANPYGASN
jgi:hypothetical protein